MTEGDFDYVHLIDMMTGEDVDMLLEGEYDFLARTNDRADRFILMLDANDVNSNSDYSNFAYINQMQQIAFLLMLSEAVYLLSRKLMTTALRFRKL